MPDLGPRSHSVNFAAGGLFTKSEFFRLWPDFQHQAESGLIRSGFASGMTLLTTSATVY